MILGISIIAIPQNDANAFSDQQITRGAYGDDVIELQARLQYLGFIRVKLMANLATTHTGLYVISKKIMGYQ